MFVVEQEKFQGPLDLLLELIQKDKLEISQVSLAKATDEFMLYLKNLEKKVPDEVADFLVIAAQLLLIKSKTLVPTLSLTEEEEISTAELEKRLKEYKLFKEIAQKLKEIEAKKMHLYVREKSYFQNIIFFMPESITPEIIRKTFIRFLKELPKAEEIAKGKIKRIISIEEKITYIRNLIETRVMHSFKLLVGSGEKLDVIISFLAILELARQRILFLEQASPFGDIAVRKIQN